MTIAVTGATGGLGALVVDALLRDVPADQVVALARDTAKAAPIADRGVLVREFDYDRPESLAPALEGVERLLLISGSDLAGRRFEQHRAVIDAAVDAAVGRLAYTSVLGAGKVSNPVAPEHVRTEEHLSRSGLDHTVLRNGWYSENYLPALEAALATGVVLTNAGDGRIASASRSDYAEAAAAVLTAERVKPVYEVAGDTAWNQADLAAALSDVLGTEIRVRDVSAGEHRSILIDSGLDERMAGFLVAIDTAIAAGDLDLPGERELSTLIGHPTTPLIDTLRAARQPLRN